MLAKENIDYIKTHLDEWLSDLSLGRSSPQYEIDLIERIAGGRETEALTRVDAAEF